MYKPSKEQMKRKRENYKKNNPERWKAGIIYRRGKKRGAKLCSCCTREEIIQFIINRPEGYHLDHIIPIFEGGLHCLKNLQFLHPDEHLEKSRIENIRRRSKC